MLFAVIVAASTPVLLRRARPWLALVLAMAGLYGVMATVDIYQTVPFPSMVAGYSLALVSSRRTTILAGLALVPFVVAAIATFGHEVITTAELPKNLAYVAAAAQPAPRYCGHSTILDPRGDVLIFLPGEREIRDAHLLLSRRQYRETEIMPLYARLSAGDQDRVFKPGVKRRVVLATNVAETSLTVACRSTSGVEERTHRYSAPAPTTVVSCSSGAVR